MAGKGDKRRPTTVSIKDFGDKYDNIFGEREQPKKGVWVFDETQNKLVHESEYEKPQKENKYPYVALSPASDHVWKVQDGLGKEHFVGHNTYKALQKDPMHTTLSDKRDQMQGNKENIG